MEEQQPIENNSCKRSVMSKIECGEVCPRSRRFFQTRECMVWALWALSVVVGALAIAVTMFVLTHRQYALYEATHDNFFTFIVEVLPFVWVLVFGLMVAVGVYNLRHTKRGYRYPLWQIFLSSVVLSFAGGAVLHLFGLGYTADHMLGERMGMYDSQEKIEKRLWQNPEEGRLAGAVKKGLVPPATTVVFEDIQGDEWSVSVVDLSAHELELLIEERPVRMLGVAGGGDKREFQPCAVFPFRAPNEHSLEDLKQERAEFMHKMAQVKQMVDDDDRASDPCLKMPRLHMAP